jgi:probable HAF family extracellular repeat protein
MKSSRIVQLAIFAMLVFGGVETAFADIAYSFTTIDVPGARDTQTLGINDSDQIVGRFVDATGAHGFVDTGGSFTAIDVPGNPGSAGIAATGINNSGEIVGWFGSPVTHGFLYTGGSLTTIDVPGADPVTQAIGINDRGQIAGWFTTTSVVSTDPLFFYHGFLYTGGSFTTIDVPGSKVNGTFGINNSGQIAGYFDDGGFVDTGGNFTAIYVPGGRQVMAYGINNSGQIVGSFVAGGRFYGFVNTGGSFTTIDVPGALSTQGAFGINENGQIVGWWFDATGEHGFLATPVPEPPSSLTLATCLVVLFAMAGRRKCSKCPSNTVIRK